MSGQRIIRASETTQDRTQAPIVIVGAGNMGGAIARGLAQAGFASRLVLVDPAITSSTFPALSQQGTRVVPDAASLAAETPDAIILAVKPQVMPQIVPSWRNAARDAVVISVAAGTTISSLQGWLGSSAALVRAMPNLPASIGKGISAAIATSSTSPGQRRLAETLLRSVGDFVWVDSEQQIDAVTAVSGSGPAYVFYLVEALAAAARDVGLPANVADTLARRTVEGAGALLEQSQAAPGELRQSVTSPGGTTEAALRILMASDGLEELVTKAVQAATRRAGELAKSG